MAETVLFEPGVYHTEANARHYLVILSDGDNVYNAQKAYSSSQNSPDPDCRPTSPGTSDADVSPNCRTAANTTQAQKVDQLSYDQAQVMKSMGVEIYVVGLSPCAHNATSLCDTSIIGDSLSDSQRNENLLKCLASSSSGTNDHYYYTALASDLPGIFTAIAHQIGHRLIE
jgi:hypothetical protein